ncbi:MAG: hypothetical protein ACJAUL_002731 [Paraglaciecola sp.]|jgi:hypothetical protein
MKYYLRCLSVIMMLFTAFSHAQLEVYKDYDLGTEIISMTTVKVDPNMEDQYLEGLRDSWVNAVKIQKDLGYIKDWKIYGSELPQSGEFNMVLMVIFNNSAELEPNEAKYQGFMKKWGEENQKNSRKISKTYPDIRSLTGEYRLREIMLK